MKTKMKLILVLAGLLVVAIGFFGWALNGLVIQEETIQIGFMSALSGDYSSMGNNVLRGVTEAVNEANSQNKLDKRIELVVEDNQANPKQAVDIYHSFKARDIDILLTSFSGIVAAINPLSKQDEVINMHNAFTENFAQENPYGFKVYGNGAQETELILEKAKEVEGKIAIVHVQNPSCVEIIESLEKEIEFSEYVFDMNEVDYRTIILKLKESEVKTVIVLGYSNHIIAIVKQSVELGYSPENILTISDGVGKETVNTINDYIQNKEISYYTIGYGDEDMLYIFGYDATKVLIEGMALCEKKGGKADDVKCLREELTKVKIQGKSGYLEMDSDGVALVSPTLYLLENGKLVPFYY